MGVAVTTGGGAVGGPAGVRNTSVGLEGLGHVGLGLGDELTELSDLANFLESLHLIFLVTIDSHTGRIVAAVFQSGQA